MVAFDEDRLDCVSVVNAPRAIQWVVQLLEEEPSHKTI
jgi:hypothetical protein